MAKKRKSKKEEEYFEDESGIEGGVGQSILALIAIAIGAVILLAIFGWAGDLGQTIDGVIAQVFGITRIIVPISFFILGAELIMRTRRFLAARSLLAISACVIGLNGILNLLFAPQGGEEIRRAGGIVGQIISTLIADAMSGLAAGVIAGAILIAGILLLLNTSLQVLLMPILAQLARQKEPKTHEYGDESQDEEVAEEESEVVEEAEVEEEQEVVEDEEVEDEAEPKPKKKGAVINYGQKAEQVMTSSGERRKIDVPMDLLENKRSEAKSGDINRNQEIIIKTLEQFGIDVEMGDVRVGPTVTQYSFRPAVGVKLSKVVALQNDLALALAAHPIRIEAPIPGKALVGIEVPNLAVARVSLREIMESKDFDKRKTATTVPLGRDISGGVPLLQIERAPHMLVAGATGSGKSVCLNGIIVSLLYQNGPDDLKLIMVDPKRVELGVYAGIPHLLVPPIVKADEAVNALKWAVREMERRLDYLAKFGARDIDSYNAKAKERMPRIIVIIDELADLMIQNKREVEATVVRIAQMARAAGIHLILATQRPSVDVITGTIKANIPTRLAFAVASQVDSKTILDIGGAEKLLGRGDMLMSTPELSKPRRVQGAFVGDGEIERVVAFLKQQSEPDYNYQVTEGSSNSGGTAFNSDDSDPLLDDAVQIALEAERVSTSFLQRRMKIGYSRAARIMDLMEQLGIIGAADGAKPREVLVSEWPPASEVEEAEQEEMDLDPEEEEMIEEFDAEDEGEESEEDGEAEIEDADLPEEDEEEILDEDEEKK